MWCILLHFFAVKILLGWSGSECYGARRQPGALKALFSLRLRSSNLLYITILKTCWISKLETLLNVYIAHGTLYACIFETDLLIRFSADSGMWNSHIVYSMHIYIYIYIYIRNNRSFVSNTPNAQRVHRKFSETSESQKHQDTFSLHINGYVRMISLRVQFLKTEFGYPDIFLPSFRGITKPAKKWFDMRVNASCCNAGRSHGYWRMYEWAQQHTATHCNTLQHAATHCNALQQTDRMHGTDKCTNEKWT